MRKLVLRLVVFAGVALTLGACADIPTQSDQQRAPDLAAPAQDEQVAPQGWRNRRALRAAADQRRLVRPVRRTGLVV